MRYCDACRATFRALTTCPRDKRPARADIGDPLLGHVLGDRYRILERISAGGMGQVYRAAHTRIASLFAVKVLYGDIAHDEQMRVRFQREAEAASCLQSRYIVRVIDFDRTPEDLLFLTMEHLDGRSLASVIAGAGALSVERSVRLARQIAVGLGHAHERGIVHRDMKSPNVMVVADDDDAEVVKLLDFGIARLQHQEGLTQAGAILGTPQYMAPEQFRGGDVDARADLYALGIILYEMLTGQTPFDSDNLSQLALIHATIPPPPLSARNPGAVAPPALEALIQRLLAKRPEDRYPSARAVADELRELARVDVPRSSSALPLSPAPAPFVSDHVAERIHGAIQVGAPAYNAGDPGGCFRVYRETALALRADPDRGRAPVAVSARLDTALRRASSAATPTNAAWEMRFAFDDLLQAHVTRPAAMPESPAGVELAAAAAIAAPRYAAGALDLVGDFTLEFARGLLQSAKQSGVSPSVIAYLTPAVAEAERAGGGRSALATIGSMLDALRQGLDPAEPSLPPLTGRLATKCRAMDELVRRISEAIAVGAPAYNVGNVDACYRIYAHTAAAIVEGLRAEESCADVRGLLSSAIERAAREAHDQGAWTLRHAFDTLLGAAVQRTSDQSRG